LDALKLAMAFMVVGIHAGFLDGLSSLGNYLTTQGFFRIAVPIFLIINGFYFFAVVTKKKHFQWLKRVTTLYLLWMFVYSYFWFWLPEFSIIEFVKLFMKVIIGYHHLWYISGMLGAAVLLLILRNMTSQLLCFSLLFTFSIGVFIQYTGNYHLYSGTIWDNLFNLSFSHRNALFFSYPFFCIGYLINKHSVHKLIKLNNVLVITLIASVALFSEILANYYHPNRDGGFDNYFTLILICPAIFILFLNLNISGNNKNIALYSSAVYFIHSLFLSILGKWTDLDGTTLTFFVIVISLFSSFFIIKLNNKLKFIL